MIAFLNWFLGEVCLLAAVVGAIVLLVDVLRVRGRELVTYLKSTALMHHIHAYEKARSRTPDGSAYPPDGCPPPPSGATGPGVEARSPAQTTPPPVPPQSPAGAGDPRISALAGLEAWNPR